MQTIISYIDKNGELKTWVHECEHLGHIIKSHKIQKYHHSGITANLDMSDIKQISLACMNQFDSLVNSDINETDPALTEKYFTLARNLDRVIADCDKIIAVTIKKTTKLKLKRPGRIAASLRALFIGFVLFSAVAWWLELGISYVQTEVCLGSQQAAVSATKDLEFEIQEHDKTTNALFNAEYELAN